MNVRKIRNKRMRTEGKIAISKGLSEYFGEKADFEAKYAEDRPPHAFPFFSDLDEEIA